MLLKDFINNGVSALSSLYPKEEARSMMICYCAEVFGFPSYQHITEPSTPVPEDLLEMAMEDMQRLASSEPLQYVLGYTEFCGRNFAVDRRALIPRAETEVLCQKAEEMINVFFGNDAKVLDLCTGSGCIAWTLALDLPGTKVCATDISEDALELAKSQFHGRSIPGWTGRLPRKAISPEFVKADVFEMAGGTQSPFTDSFHLLTANPPYVMSAEKTEMRPNVLDWEPHMAIFAPDKDPLAFHKAIAVIAAKDLMPGGRGIVEINSELPVQTAGIFKKAGFSEITIVPDYFDRPRFVSFAKPEA